MAPDPRSTTASRAPGRADRSRAGGDLALTGGLLAYGVVEAVLISSGEAHRAGRVVAALAMVIPLLWRRHKPLPVLIAVIGVIVGGTLTDLVPTDAILPLPAFVIAFFSAAAYAPAIARAVSVGAVALIATWFGLALSETPDDIPAYLGVSFIAAASFALGRVVHRRTRESAHLAQLSHRLEQEQEARAREAVDEERARIGRELHDIVAHSISLIAVQSGAAAAMVRRDPDKAVASIQSVETAARDALGEMRRLLGMLREGELNRDRSPQPSLAHVNELVDRAHNAGQEVGFNVSGERPQLAPGVDLAGYRIVQESLTNARKHGAGKARVAIVYGRSKIEIEVNNPMSAAKRPPAPGGHGLIGMRERVRLYGGRFAAGPQPDGTYQVSVTLPIGNGPP